MVHHAEPPEAQEAPEGRGDEEVEVCIAKETLGVIFTDVIGPITPPAHGGYRYIVTFLDDHTRFLKAAALKEKAAVGEAFKQYVALAENETGRKVKRVHSDNGGEYIAETLQQYLKEKGIRHTKTAPDSAAQNGASERNGRSVMEMTRCALQDSKAGRQDVVVAVLQVHDVHQKRNASQRYWTRAIREVPWGFVRHHTAEGVGVYCILRCQGGQARRSYKEDAIRWDYRQRHLHAL